MKKILGSSAIQRIDSKTMERQSITSIDLMEIAAFNLFQTFISNFSDYQSKPIHIFCGNGNNGGDGLVIARLLSLAKWDVKVYIVRFSENSTEEFTHNLNRLEELAIPILELNESNLQPFIQKSDVLIDALFGSGLNRSVQGFVGKIIDQMNASEKIISIDLPSGLMAGSNRENSLEHVVKARHTLSIEVPKLSLFMPTYFQYVGEWQMVDIGLDELAIDEEESHQYFIQLADVKQLIKPSNKFAHKGSNGHALLITGSYGMMGAAVLSANAALRSGVGLLSVHSPKCGVQIIQETTPQAMVDVDVHEYFTTGIQNTKKYQAIGIGPGYGQSENSKKAFYDLLKQADQPMVMDADALNILAENKEWFSFIPKYSILTPHPGEFKRLVGEWESDEEKLEKLQSFSQQTNSYIILKGAFSCLCTPDGNCYFNSTGNEGMAKGGSGDVLTGILTALLAQGYSSQSAALIGMMVHGLAGDIAADHKGTISMNAQDIIDFLPEAFLQLS